jgi:hypothetical protein
MDLHQTPQTRNTVRRVLGRGTRCALGVLGLGTVVTVGAAGLAGAATTTLDGAGKVTPSVITSAHVEFALRIALPGHYVTEMRGNGAIDFTGSAATMTLEQPASGLHANALAKGTHLPSSGQVVMKGEWVDGAAYLTLPASLAALVDGPTTFSYPVPAATASDITTALSQTAVAVSYAHILVGALGGRLVGSAGRRTIHGVRVSGTEVDLTLSQLLKVVPALSPVLAASLTPMAHVEIPVTVWVDRKGRLVEATMSQPASARTGISGSVRFFEFDAPVTITTPTAGSVRSASKGELALVGAEDPLQGAG